MDFCRNTVYNGLRQAGRAPAERRRTPKKGGSTGMEGKCAPGKTRAMDMTQGPISRLLLAFALPLLLGNLFQQLYNTVDSMILGNFVSKQALAAVGSTTPLCNTLVNFFNGVSVGAGVVISNCFGAKKDRELHTAVETTMTAALLIGCAAALLSVPFVPGMLALISTPADVLEPASVYLRIYFMGVIFLFTYNMGSCILRAVGDTRRPLLFLIVSSLLNIALDLLFVLGFRMGIAGAALATVLSEAVSAVLVCLCLARAEGAWRLTLREMRIDLPIFRRILTVGMPVGIQQALTAFSNTFVQSYINAFDNTDLIAGWSSYVKIDQFILLPVQSIGQAVTTFVSQNLGAGRLERAKAGTRTAARLGTGLLLCVSLLILCFARPLVRLFNSDPQVLHYGVLIITLMTPFHFFSAWNQTYAGALRGAGDSRGPMLLMLFSFVLVRQVYLFTVTRFVNSIYTVALGYPVGWIACALLTWQYYRRSGWEKHYRGQDPAV